VSKRFIQNCTEKAKNQSSIKNVLVYRNERTQHNKFSSVDHSNSIGVLSTKDPRLHIHTIVFFHVYRAFVFTLDALAQQEETTNAGEYYCDNQHCCSYLLSWGKID
tara:strand:- start:157 stop:474 length:318 start_codon:yes stop_codon:yes gene_type:complete